MKPKLILGCGIVLIIAFGTLSALKGGSSKEKEDVKVPQVKTEASKEKEKS